MRRKILQRGEWLWWGVLAVLALPLVWADEVPTLDGPAHVYTAAVLRDLSGGDPGIYREVFRLDWKPWPNWAVQSVLAAVGPWMGWAAAEKGVLLAVFLSLPLAFRYLLVRWGGEGGAAGMLIFPLAHHHLLYLGFWNFTLGMAGVVALAGWVGGRWESPRRMGWGVGVWGLVLYFCHPLAWGLGALVASGLWWRRGCPRGWVWWALLWLPSGLLAAWFLAVSRNQGDLEWMPVLEVLGQVLRLDVAEPFRSGVPLLALGAGWLVAGWVAVRLRHAAGPVRERAVWALALAAVSLGLCLGLPESGAGGSLVAYRMSLVPWLWILAAGGLLMADAPTGLRWGLAGVALAAAGGALASLSGAFRTHQEEAAAVRSLLAQVRDGEVMEVRMDPELRTQGRWRTAVWEHASARVVRDGRRVAWPEAYQMSAHGFPVRRMAGPGDASVVLVWGGAPPPPGWRCVAMVEVPRVGLWRQE